MAVLNYATSHRAQRQKFATFMVTTFLFNHVSLLSSEFQMRTQPMEALEPLV